MTETGVFSEHLMKGIRARFENVESDPVSGPRIYFENAGGTLRLKSVMEVVRLFTGLPDNAGRRNKTSRLIAETIKQGRAAVRLLLGADEGRIISEQSGTGMIFRILGTIARSVKGGNIVTTNLEHPAVYDACHILARRHGLECRVAGLDPRSGSVPVDAVARLVDRDTVFVAVIHSSNILGTVNDVARMIQESRKIKADLFTVIDGCQYASHGVMDVTPYEADGYIFDSYKVYGKIGTNFAHVTDRLARLDRDNLQGKAPHDWDLGTREPAAFAAIGCVAEYLRWLGGHYAESAEPRRRILAAMRAIEGHERGLAELLLNGGDGRQGLLTMPGVRVYGEARDLSRRQAIVAFNVAGASAADVVDYLEEEGVRVHNRTSDAYSRHTLEALGLAECVRVSLAHYNAGREVLFFLDALREYFD